ncbi:MAG: hypothetical protein VX000_07810, partial [Myxococcota bacterium]|nr:hypothetical protein [Myxococcota bacterium]
MSSTPTLPRSALAAVFSSAFVVRVGWVLDAKRLPDAADLAEHLTEATGRKLAPFVGHEDLLLRAFAGQPPDASAQAWPAAIGLHQAAGLLTNDPRILVAIAALSGAAAAVLAAIWAGRRFGTVAGVWTGILVALLGEHAAWSTSTYPVIHGHMLLMAGLVVRNRLGAGALLAAAASLRPDLAPLALLGGLPGLAALPVAAAQLLFLPGPTPTDPMVALGANLPMLRFLGPPVLVLGLVALRDRRAWPVLGAAILTHLLGSCFADYGARHALLGGVALCVLGGAAAARTRHVLGIVIAVGLAWDTADIASAWHAGTPPAAAALALPEPDGTCVEVSGEPPIPGQPIPSHLSPGTARA